MTIGQKLEAAANARSSLTETIRSFMVQSAAGDSILEPMDLAVDVGNKVGYANVNGQLVTLNLRDVILPNPDPSPTPSV